MVLLRTKYIDQEKQSTEGKKFTKRFATWRRIIRARQLIARDIREAYALHQYSSRTDGSHPMINLRTLDRGRNVLG